MKLWFMKSEETDEKIRSEFGYLVERALTGDLAHWEATPSGTVALVVLLDQFTRNIFRGNPKSFAGDTLCLQISKRAVAKGFDMEVGFFMRSFLYLPFEHSESKEDQTKSVKLFTRLRDDAPVEFVKPAASTLDYAIRHKAVIDRFGRYPHRNKVLGRESTTEEIEFLKQPGSSF
ncbi:hypothetical protein CYMTET_55800 [Cymbomonas tetramitiformis]|uniref:DUF924 domain-containing protein n=1 Tax=Cymbomonas tetramitiformis TaxID=36881 RepID=A0AAE0BDE2_9CHLO|nr:hypothetical protein CYMTET_55800 [Cymbomonas tetramitiformis]